MPYTREQLISIAQQYFRNDREYEDSGRLSPEAQRFHDRWAEEIKRLDWWHGFSEELRRSFPHLVTGNHPATCDSSWKYLVYENTGCKPPAFRFVVAGCVSVLAPVYTIYAVQYDFGEYYMTGPRRLNPRLSLTPFPPEMREIGDIMARKIEEYFKAELLPREILETPVPLIANFQEPPHTNLLHVLFSSEPCALP